MGKNNGKLSLFFIFLIVFSGGSSSQSSQAWERIVTLNPLISEWTAEILGKEESLKRVVGASEYSRYPDFMSSIPTVGPYPNLQVEKILSLKPDLVLGSLEYNSKQQLDQLRSMKLNVVLLPKESFYGMPQWIQKLGDILNQSDQARKKGELWRIELKKIKTPPQKKRVFFQIQFEPLVTLGRSSFLNEAFQHAGYENVFGSMATAYPRVSKESVLRENPETIFVFEMVKNQEDLEKIRQSWKNRDIRILSGDDFSRCSPGLLKALRGMK